MSSLLLTAGASISQIDRYRPEKLPTPLVLIVDDHADTRDLLRYVVEMIGARVVDASDGEEAIQLATRTIFDLILMDTSLPRVDGLMATKRIRQLDGGGKIGIFFLSGHAQPQSRDLALAAGADEYFVKPLNLVELELALRKRLMISKSARA
jgi:two-component system phosphate regulon response regulator PhoB